MTHLSVNAVAALAQRTADLFTRYKQALTDMGFDATDRISDYIARANALPTTDVTQEDAKSSQSAQTDALTADAHAAYANASNALGAALGFLGKADPDAQETKRLRAGVHNDTSGPQVAIFVQDVVAFLTAHSDALKAQKYDPTAKIAELSGLSATLLSAKGQQEQKKTNLTVASKTINAAKDALYDDANTALQGAMGLFPADSEFVAEAHRIRVEAYGPNHHVKPPPAPAANPTTSPPAA